MSPLNLNAFWLCLILALASSSIAMTLTQTELFASYRALMKRLHPQLGHLAQCFYCTSHWIVIAAVSIYLPPIVASGYAVVDWIVAVFFTLTLTTFICGLIFKVFLTAMSKAVKEQEMRRLMAQLTDQP